MFVIVVVRTNKMDEINNVNILGFRSIMFDFIIGENVKRFVIIRIGNFDVVGFYEEFRMKVEKIEELVVSHMVCVFFNNG